MKYQYGNTVVESGEALDSILFKPVNEAEPAEPTKAADKQPAKTTRTRKAK